MKIKQKAARVYKSLARKTREGFRGYPIGTLAFYGPDDTRASKLVVSIIESEGAGPTSMKKWFDDERDLRYAEDVLEDARAFLTERGARSVGMMGRILGCPHEEGVDYEGPICPKCPFWANVDRWTGETIQ